MNSTLKRKVEDITGIEADDESDLKEMLNQLKSKFKETNSNRLKVMLLTILPQSWSERRIAAEFETTQHMARTAKKLV